MIVTKRDGRTEPVKFDKITARIEKQSYGLDTNWIFPQEIAQKVISGLYDGITTVELDILAAEMAASNSTRHPDYNILAGRLIVSLHHKQTEKSFSKTMKKLYEYINPKTNKPAPLVSEEIYKIIQKNASVLDSTIVQTRDFDLDYFAFKTLEKSYLLKTYGKPIERPQHMYMRVALGIHKDDLEAAIETYHDLSLKYYTHATPTLFNAGTPRPQLSSCFLLHMEDSIEGIQGTKTEMAHISKWAGGIGLDVSSLRSAGSYINGTGGTSKGIIPIARTINNEMLLWDQGGDKRKGSCALYMQPWHPDFMDFLELKKNNGKEEMRARDLFYAAWIPDIFMKQVEIDGDWHFLDPSECPELTETYGEEFEALYFKYIEEGKFVKKVKAQSVWNKILESQTETGGPYMLYKDSFNKKSNQKNIGIIRSSNLCCEISEVTDSETISNCNLASISLPSCLTKVGDKYSFDFYKLKELAAKLTRNLNRVIDVNYYAVEKAETTNKRDRPIGIGVQGLADVFILLGYPFDSLEARLLNKEIFETIYYGALEKSCELAQTDGPYMTFEASPLSEGKFQFDLWENTEIKHSGRWDWEKLRANIIEYGVTNSLFIAPMPTATTSQILGNNECFEPYTSNLYNRRVLAGEFIVVNKYLIKELIRLGVWDNSMRQYLMANDGSIQNIDGIPQETKDLYKTAYDIKQKVIIDMAADRAVYIDQSQSMNIFMSQPTPSKLSSMHFYGWKAGLKTGMYYLRSKAAVAPVKFTIDVKVTDTIKKGGVFEVQEEVYGQVCEFGDGSPDCNACGA